MARVLSDETSLARQKSRLASESRLLRLIHPVEFGLAAVLLLGGVIQYINSDSRSLLVIGGVVAFLAIGHFFKAKESRAQHGIVSAGRRGEVEVNDALLTELDNSYYILNDLLLKHAGRVAQVDHLVISPKGIFVIETKNWSGHVSGSEKAPTWTQTKDHARDPVQLKNPIEQNQRHVRVLEGYLRSAGIEWPEVIPLLIFSSSRTTFDIADRTVDVLRARQAGSFIASYPAERLHDEEEINKVIESLMKAI